MIKNENAVKSFRVFYITNFVILALLALIFGISDTACGFIDLDIIGDDGLGDFLFWALVFGIPAWFDLTVGALIANLCENIQAINEKIKSEKQEKNQ